MRSLVLSVCVAFVAADAAHAQKIDVLEFSGSGRLLGFSAGSMAYVNAQGQRQEVKFAKAGEMSVTLKPAKGLPQPVVAGPPTVDITGQLAPEQIRAGLTVVFNCTLDSKGAAARPVEAVKVLDVRPDGPGIHADGEPSDAGQPVLVKGIAKGFKKGVLTVSVPKHDLAPKGVLTIAVADTADVSFESHNPRFATRGAEVEVKGFQMGPNGEVAVNSIAIKLPAPAGRTPKKSPDKANPAASPDGKQQDGKPQDGDAKPDEPKTPKPSKILPLGFEGTPLE
jgi:hypothetical protein